MKLQPNIPLLIDFDGVLKIGDKPAEGIKDFLSFIMNKKVPACILSNSTLKTGQDIKDFLNSNKIESDLAAMSAVDATLSFVKNNYKKISVYAEKEIQKIFSDFLTNESAADEEAVVIGDLGKNWTYEILNEIFRKVYNGAELVAMQKNKFWKPDGKTIALDAGAFISSIEYATGKEAKLIGKPSPIFFRTALKILDYPEDSEFIMLGDDIETDINAAQKIGGKGVLIYAGKTKYPLPEDSKIRPDHSINTLQDFIRLYN